MLFPPRMIMTVGITTPVIIRVATAPAVDLTVGLLSPQEYRQKAIQIPALPMRLDMYSDTNSVNVELKIPKEGIQDVPPDRYAEWVWEVTPIQAGDARLTLDLFSVNEGTPSLEAHDIAEVDVSARSPLVFVNDFWTQLLGVLPTTAAKKAADLIVAGIVTGLGILFRKRRAATA